MTDDEILNILRSQRRLVTAVELAVLLGELKGVELSQPIIVTYFQRAFPDIPLRVFLDAAGWDRVSDGGVSDAEFNEMLGRWLQESQEKQK